MVISNTRPIVPFKVSLKGERYPDVGEMFSCIHNVTSNVVTVDGSSIAQKLGSVKVLNTVLLGVLAGSAKHPFDNDLLLDNIHKNIPQKFVELNRSAFFEGLKRGKSASPNSRRLSA